MWASEPHLSSQLLHHHHPQPNPLLPLHPQLQAAHGSNPTVKFADDTMFISLISATMRHPSGRRSGAGLCADNLLLNTIEIMHQPSVCVCVEPLQEMFRLRKRPFLYMCILKTSVDVNYSLLILSCNLNNVL